MKTNLQPEIYISVIMKFCEVCDRSSVLKERLRRLPKRVELIDFLFQNISKKEFQVFLKSTTDMEERLKMCDPVIGKLEKSFQDYLSKVMK